MGTALATTPKIKRVTVVQVTRPLSDSQKAAARMADLIERGMQKHPTWKQAHGVEYRSKRNPTTAWHAKESPQEITRACAIGFAMAGNDFLPDPVLDLGGLRSKVIGWNDHDHKTLPDIINLLRAEASTH